MGTMPNYQMPQHLSHGQINHLGPQQVSGTHVIPTNIISGTYINSNIIVHHQKTKSNGNNGSMVAQG